MLAILQLMAMSRLAVRVRKVASDKGNEINKRNDGERPRLANHVARHAVVGANNRDKAEGHAADGEEAEADEAEDGPALSLLHNVHSSQEQEGGATSDEDVDELELGLASALKG